MRKCTIQVRRLSSLSGLAYGNYGQVRTYPGGSLAAKNTLEYLELLKREFRCRCRLKSLLRAQGMFVNEHQDDGLNLGELNGMVKPIQRALSWSGMPYLCVALVQLKHLYSVITSSRCLWWWTKKSLSLPLPSARPANIQIRIVFKGDTHLRSAFLTTEHQLQLNGYLPITPGLQARSRLQNSTTYAIWQLSAIEQ